MTILVGKRKTSKVTWLFAALAVAFILGDLAGLLLPAWKASQAAKTAIEFSGTTMGTTYSLKAWWGESIILQEDIDRRLENINQMMSTYLPDSELSRFNNLAAGDWFEVSEETAFVVTKALHYHQLTTGASDVTVGPLVRLWDFGPGRHTIGAKLKTPSEETIAAALECSGANKLEVRQDPPSLRKNQDGLEVDLSSIAKGYAVDVLADFLLEHGYQNFMVEIGGEVRAQGTRQDGKIWRIGVEKPDLKQRAIHKIVSLQDQALATSGDYRNFREFDGKKYSHIIDPKTGRPLPYRGWSVTLLAPTCLEADALATALLVMGEDRGYDWCVEHEVAALFLIRQRDEIVEVATPKFLEQHPPSESPTR